MRLGIMQGRLVPPEAGRFQSFPRERWRDEFGLAERAGLDAIEWIYDGYGESANPLSNDAGADELRQFQRLHKIDVVSCCADWFMDFPLVGVDAAESAARWQRLGWLVGRCRTLDIERIVIPFVDASAIRTPRDQADLVSGLSAVIATVEASGVELHLETALAPREFAALLDEIDHPMIRVNYDIGNSASLGYDPDEEFAAYGERIGSVHIKDRALGGGTVPLGRGAARIESVFRHLREVRYRGDFVLQVARGAPGEELEWTRKNLTAVRGFIDAWFSR